MDEAAEQSGQEGSETVTALVVRHLDGRPARMHDDTADGDDADVCIVYEPDTPEAAAAWLIAERSFIAWCSRSEAVAELVRVTVPEPDDPADLEAILQIAAMTATVSYGFVRVADLYAEAG